MRFEFGGMTGSMPRSSGWSHRVFAHAEGFRNAGWSIPTRQQYRPRPISLTAVA
jgi:hypothetical protein